MSDESAAKKKGGAEKGRQKHRSPNYPLFDLGKAVELTKKLYDSDKTHKIPIGVVHDRWGYKKHSSAGNQAVAAAKSYGLVSVEGSGEARQIAVTDVGRRIVLNAPDRAQLLKSAAVGPSLFNSLWESYRQSGLPSDDVLRHHLVFDRNFNEDVVAYAIDRFKNTVAFAGLVAGDKIEGGGGGDDEESGDGDNDVDDRSNKGEGQPKGFSSPKPPSGTRDFPLYTSGSKGALYVPERMSKKDYELLKLQIQNSLAVIEATAVVDEQSE